LAPALPRWYMGRLRDERTGLAIHLHKHRDTRRYSNLDDDGHAYAYAYFRSAAIDAFVVAVGDLAGGAVIATVDVADLRRLRTHATGIAIADVT
jgi:hypothetical protein